LENNLSFYFRAMKLFKRLEKRLNKIKGSRDGDTGHLDGTDLDGPKVFGFYLFKVKVQVLEF
jgi:hypothetical protein